MAHALRFMRRPVLLVCALLFISASPLSDRFPLIDDEPRDCEEEMAPLFSPHVATLKFGANHWTFVLQGAVPKSGDPFTEWLQLRGWMALAPHITDEAGPMRIQWYEGDQLVKEWPLPRDVEQPAALFAYRSGRHAWLVILDDAGRAPMEDEGRVHLFKVQPVRGGTYHIEPEQSFASGGIRPRFFFRSHGKAIILNQGQLAAEEPIIGSIKLCSDSMTHCQITSLHDPRLTRSGWTHGYPRDATVGRDRVLFSQWDWPALVLTLDMPSRATCRRQVQSLPFLQEIGFICNGPLRLRLAAGQVVLKAGGTSLVFATSEATDSEWIPEAVEPVQRFAVGSGEAHLSVEVRKLVYHIKLAEDMDLVLNVHLHDTDRADEFSLYEVVGATQGPLPLLLEAEFYEGGGGQLHMASQAHRTVGDFSIGTRQLRYHYIRDITGPLGRIGPEQGFEWTDTAGASWRLQFGNTWSAVAGGRLPQLGADAKDLSVLLLGSPQSLDVIALSLEHSDRFDLLGLWRPATDDYAMSLMESLERVNPAQFLSGIPNSSPLNSILTAGVGALALRPGASDFNLVARLGTGDAQRYSCTRLGLPEPMFAALDATLPRAPGAAPGWARAGEIGAEIAETAPALQPTAPAGWDHTVYRGAPATAERQRAVAQLFWRVVLILFILLVIFRLRRSLSQD